MYSSGKSPNTDPLSYLGIYKSYQNSVCTNTVSNSPNHVIFSMNRVKNIQLLIDYQCNLLKSVLVNSSLLDQYEIKLI